MPPDQIDVTYYRDALVAHADSLATRLCATCLMSRCPDRQNAYDRLTAADELMTAPQRWQGVARLDLKRQP